MFRYQTVLTALFFGLTFCPSHAQDIVAAREKVDIGGHRICDPRWRDDQTIGLDLLTSALWTAPQVGGTSRTYYVVGAPWCPYCKQLYQLAKRGETTDIEFRFILQDPGSARDLMSMVDVAKNGPQGLERLWGRAPRPASPSDVSPHDIEFIGDAVLLEAHILKLEQEPVIAEYLRAGDVQRLTWGSPVVFEARRHGGATFPIGYVGMPRLQTPGGLYARLDGVPSAARALVRRPPAIVPGRFHYERPDQTTVRVHSLPTSASPSLCYDARQWTLEAEGTVEIGDERWARVPILQVSPVYGGGSPITVSGYVRLGH